MQQSILQSFYKMEEELEEDIKAAIARMKYIPKGYPNPSDKGQLTKMRNRLAKLRKQIARRRKFELKRAENPERKAKRPRPVSGMREAMEEFAKIPSPV
ncbi:MAG: hypothetical protein KGI60_01045 [Patescibacteria group bacterium]|nr:hypothetical protein [Patescibacteria group bacterium]